MSNQDIYVGAKEIVDEMQNRGNYQAVAERLAYDSQVMSISDYRRLLNHVEVLQDNQINLPEGPKHVKMHVRVDDDHLQKNGFPTVTLVDDGTSHFFGAGIKTINDPRSTLADQAMTDGNSDKIETRR